MIKPVGKQRSKAKPIVKENAHEQAIEFSDLFKGFDFLADSLIATLLHLDPMLVIFVPRTFFYVGMIFMIPRNGEPDPTAMLTFFGLFAIFWLVMMVVLIIVSAINLRHESNPRHSR